HAVHDDWRGFHRLSDVGLEYPGHLQPFDVLGGDLVGWIKAVLIVVAVGRQKILAVFRGVVEHRLRDILLRRRNKSQRDRHRPGKQNRSSNSLHWFPPICACECAIAAVVPTALLLVVASASVAMEP